jgi:N-acyl-D-amino-acid deacylase
LRDAANPDRIGRMRRIFFAFMVCVGAAAAIPTAAVQNTQQPFDILIKNGRVLDGSGNPGGGPTSASRDRIVAVGTLTGATATAVVDAKDRVVAPGFFDVHSHALDGLTRAELRDGRPLLAQGVTTIVGNPDGGGGTDLKRQFATIEADGGVGVNVALLVGHASVRSAVMGEQQRREPTAAELDRMIALVKQGVADGAFGLSSGLFYQPGRFSKTEEVIALARAAGGVYSSHIRDEGDYDYGLIPSVDEVIRIAEEGHVRGVVSHVKALGPDNWGKSKTIVEHIDAARARGVEVYADQYPYEASSTSLSAAVMPSESSACAQGSDGRRGVEEGVPSARA